MPWEQGFNSQRARGPNSPGAFRDSLQEPKLNQLDLAQHAFECSPFAWSTSARRTLNRNFRHRPCPVESTVDISRRANFRRLNKRGPVILAHHRPEGERKDRSGLPGARSARNERDPPEQSTESVVPGANRSRSNSTYKILG